MKAKIGLAFALVAICAIMCTMLCFMGQFDNEMAVTMETSMDGARYSSVRGQDLTEAQMKARVENSLSSSVTVPENQAIENIESSGIIANNYNLRDVATIAAFVVILLSVSILWISDSIRKWRDNAWKRMR